MTRALFRRTLVLMPLLTAIACFPEHPQPNGSCVVESSSLLDCNAPGYDGGAVPAGLVPYSCTGSARPDDSPAFIDGVPRGLVCADRGPIGDSGAQGYCCTEQATTCAYDPVASCNPSTYGYQCWGANRPESLNPAITCSNGFDDANDNLIDYCCSGRPTPSPCQQSNALGCDGRLMGFLCKGAALPNGEDLGPNESRADYFRPICSVGKAQGNPDYKAYCCYMPAPVQAGATCIWDPSVPGCAAGRFGFACYGPDTPPEDYYPMQCPAAGVHGKDANNYPATLYCCDY